PSPAVSAAFDLQASKDTVTCFGDGKSGARIEALHVVDSAKKKTPTGDLRRYVARAAKVVEDSSRKHGGDVKTLRVLHDSNCRPIIKQVVVPRGVFKGSFYDLTSYLREKGYDSIHRKYLLFV